MREHYFIAIVGSGPAGLSAAGRAAELGKSHILLEQADHAADTIFKYQRGKLVMATPNVLPLRSEFPFTDGSREEVLGNWDEQLQALDVNIRHSAEVTRIQREQEAFRITLRDGQELTADKVVLAIGLQGNLRKLDVPGAAAASHVQYQLDDPEEYEAETIVVIGAGDAGIENAVALAAQNDVIIVNRKGEFARVKDGNLSLIMHAIENGILTCLYYSEPSRVDPGSITLDSPDGEIKIDCDRVIARLGATAPRAFVESCGIGFPSADRTALPEISSTYESDVPGLYIIGALAGYPLIKSALNQGYEVIEFILGNDIRLADEPLLEERFELLGGKTVDEVLAMIRSRVPIFAELPALVLRELMIDATIWRSRPGEVIFERNDYTTTFFAILQGEVMIEIDPDDPTTGPTLKEGEFFGEMGLIAGRRRSATVRATTDSFLIEVPRRSMIKLLGSFESAKRVVDTVALVRLLHTYLSPNISADDLSNVMAKSTVENHKQNDVLCTQGDAADGLYMIRSGSVTISLEIGGVETVVAYVPAGHYVGEMALVSDKPRTATVRAAVATEILKIDGDAFKQMMDQTPGLRHEIEATYRDRLVESEQILQAKDGGNIIQFLVEQGLGESTDVLLIDESLCIRCDNCEHACAETHGGISRLDRAAGPSFANVHVPTSCRHCEHPHCMADCPPDAIHRAPGGEVYIDDSCIGCGNCEINCPYDVIHMAAIPSAKGGLLSWLLFGRGSGPGEDPTAKGKGRKVAVKCDMCKDIAGGAACVRACPTGAAIRVKPEQFMSIASLAKQ